MSGPKAPPAAASAAPLGLWERRFLMVVVSFTLYVAFWGLLFPAGLGVDLPGVAKDFNRALPFNLIIPPLHARFIGALYLGASVIQLLALRRGQTWREQRICVWVVLLWTAMLALISLMHLEIFDWDRRPVRPLAAWWLAYIWFPLQAAWLLWRRADRPGAAGRAQAADRPLVAILSVLGLVLTAIALLLFIAPGTGVLLWPWKLPPILGRIYSGPFLTLGIAALLAARAADHRERSGYLWSILVCAVGTLAASVRHLDLFDFGRIAPWVWFGGLLLGIAALSTWGLIPALRRSS